MARTNTYKCAVCGTTYEFCLKCQVAKPDYDAEKFCSHKHADIYATLSKHGCNLISADEVLTELSAYNLDEITLTEDVLSHVEKIKSEAGVESKKAETIVVPVEIAESVVEKVAEQTIVKYNKKNKNKKW